MEKIIWLEDQSNQEDLYAICENAILSLAPEQEPLLAELFPKYMTMSQKGDVVLDSLDSKPFRFSGTEDLVTLVLIPFVVELFNTLLLSYGLLGLKDLRARWRNRNQNVGTTENKTKPPPVNKQLVGLINETINQGEYDFPDQQKFVDSLIVAINGYLESADR